MSQGIVVAHVGDVEEDEGIKIPADVLGTVDDVALLFDGQDYYALDNTCTHETADLSDGLVDEGCVECPMHGAQFCLKDGSAQSFPAVVGVAVHQVEVDGQDIRITPNPERLAE